MYHAGNSCFVQIALDEAGKVEGCSHHRWQKDDKQKIGLHAFENATAGKFKDVIDDIVVVLEEHDGCKSDIEGTDISQFIGIGYEGIDVFHDLFGLCWHEVGKNKCLYLVIHFVKKRKCGKNIEQNDQQRNNGEDSIPAQTGSIVAQSIV